MDNRVHNQDRSYRRGLVLGLTMAEIMVLIIFALLLALAAALKASHDKIIASEKKTEQLQADLKVYEDNFRKLIAGSGGKTSAEDIFKEMRLQRDRARAAEAEANRLKPFEQKAKELEDIYKELRAAGIDKLDSAEGRKRLSDSMQIAKSAMNAFKSQPGFRPDLLPDRKYVADMMSVAHQVMNESKRPGAAPDPAQISQILRDARLADQRVRDAIGQNRYLEGELKKYGRGGGAVPCWTNPDTGRTEYIFDVSIGSTGFIITKNDLPHRVEQYDAMQIAPIDFGRVLSQQEFTRMTMPLKTWGDKQEQKCWFAVRLYDVTKADEKATFKKYMLVTGRSFQWYLVE